MDIFKIIGVGLIGGILSMTVKQYKKEYALLVALATSFYCLKAADFYFSGENDGYIGWGEYFFL